MPSLTRLTDGNRRILLEQAPMKNAEPVSLPEVPDKNIEIKPKFVAFPKRGRK